MIERAAIETLLNDAYAARVQGDLDKVMSYSIRNAAST